MHQVTYDNLEQFAQHKLICNIVLCAYEFVGIVRSNFYLLFVLFTHFYLFRWGISLPSR